MVLSGIRPSFPSLSRSTGQITHVLLTRSPLEHPHQKSGGLSVRLACVKHAASVRPEPGSNSPKKQTKKQNRQKTKKSTKQTTNNKHYSCSCSRSCSCSNNKNLLHQMTHYRVLKQHHHPQPHPKPGKGRKQRPHKYTNPTTKPQTTTSQQQKPGKTIQSLLACTLDVTNTGT